MWKLLMVTLSMISAVQVNIGIDVDDYMEVDQYIDHDIDDDVQATHVIMSTRKLGKRRQGHGTIMKHWSRHSMTHCAVIITDSMLKCTHSGGVSNNVAYCSPYDDKDDEEQADSDNGPDDVG